MERWEKRIFILAMAFLFAMASFTVASGQDIKIGVIGPMQFVQGHRPLERGDHGCRGD